jgi:5-methylcytosine-specific restriction enzyme B
MQEIKDVNIEMVQFHQSYSYEDFVQGLRPTQRGNFDLKEGIFFSFCQRALAHPDRPFFFYYR